MPAGPPSLRQGRHGGFLDDVSISWFNPPMNLHPLLPVLLALAATGCSSLSGNGADAGPPPTISSATFPPTASIGSDGA